MSSLYWIWWNHSSLLFVTSQLSININAYFVFCNMKWFRVPKMNTGLVIISRNQILNYNVMKVAFTVIFFVCGLIFSAEQNSRWKTKCERRSETEEETMVRLSPGHSFICLNLLFSQETLTKTPVSQLWSTVTCTHLVLYK